MASFTEDLMALGDWSVELDYRADLYDEVTEEVNGKRRPRKVHVRIYDPEGTHVFTGVLLRAASDPSKIRIGGRGMAWWLDGNVIEYRDYVSGFNKLSEPDFALGGIYWDLAENTKWSIHSFFPPSSSSIHAGTVGVPEADDILRSAESFPTQPGWRYTTSALVGLFGQIGLGHIRLRTVYTGTFRTMNLASPYSAWSTPWNGEPAIHYETDPQGIVPGPVLRIQTAMPNLIPNGSFDDGPGSLNGWIPWGGIWELGDDGGHNGIHYLHTDGGPDWKALVSSADGGITFPQLPQSVSAGQQYEMWMVARTNPGSPATDGEVLMTAGLTGSGEPLYLGEDQIIRPDGGVGNWRLAITRITIPDNMGTLTPQVRVIGQTTGRWDFDDLTLIRTKGNWDAVTGPVIVGIPERTYRCTLPYRIDASVTDAIVQLRAVCKGPERVDLWVDGPTISPNVDQFGRQQISWDLTLPSGYTTFIPLVYVADVHGGAYFLGEWTIVDTDTTTSVVDNVYRPGDFTGYTNLSSSSTAPLGAESVHVELVAEAQSGQWIASYVSIARTDIGPHTGNHILADLLTDPITGLPLSVSAGTINCPEVIPYDWTVRNLTNLEALWHYCEVISDPAREWFITPSRLLNVARIGVFEGHGPDDANPIVLLVEDRDVQSMPNVEMDVEDRYTAVKIIGADRHRVSGGPDISITAMAQTDGAPEVDYNGRAFSRTKIVTNAAVDGAPYAQALADDLAARETDTPLSAKVRLSGANTRPAFKVGDWVHIYSPKAGLTSPDNPTMIEGEEVFPREVRVWSRTTNCGAGYRFEIRRTDGTVFDLDFNPEGEDSAELTVGDRLVDWQSDPQGRSEGEQYVADRKSRPR